jgi:prepilin-type N-terminal cleavage/methylation domain-containing protein
MSFPSRLNLPRQAARGIALDRPSPASSGPASGRGFTLVELLAVIAIAALLAALAFPAVASMISKGQEADAVQDLRSLYSATIQYSADNNGTMFFVMDSGGKLGWRSLWPDKLTPYLPAAGPITHTTGRNPAFYNTKVKPSNRWIADYGPNDNLLRENNETWGNFPSGPPRLSAVREPAKEVMYVEAANNTANRKPTTSGSFTLWSKQMAQGNLNYDNTIARRHGPTNNPAFYAVFSDGHTERVNFNSFSTNTALRYQMFSAKPSGDSLYQ